MPRGMERFPKNMQRFSDKKPEQFIDLSEIRTALMAFVLMIVSAVWIFAEVQAQDLAQESAQEEEQKRGGIINVAIIGELNTLDPTIASGDNLGTVTQHFFETLYSFNDNLEVVPLLAETLPEISSDGLTYKIPLRAGIKFHNGKDMTATDVVASIERWVRVAVQARVFAEALTMIEASDDFTVTIRLNKSLAPLLPMLAQNGGAAIIIPAELAGTDEPLTEFIGTGPYRLKERRVDQYTQLVRFEDYRSRDGEPDGLGGARRQYADEIRFVPVPDSSTRLEGILSGQFDFADFIPTEGYERLVASQNVDPVLLKSSGWLLFILNQDQGLMTNLKIRQAFQAALSADDMLVAAFSRDEFYTIDGRLYPEKYIWRNDEGIELYNQANIEKAKELLQEAGYQGETVRLLNSRQYEFHNKIAQVAAEYLRMAGFNVQLDVVDWATLLQRRNTDPTAWDVAITHYTFQPEPSTLPNFAAGFAGWWRDEKKEALFEDLNRTLDQDKRKEIVAALQREVYAQVPFYKIGDLTTLSAKSNRLEGVKPVATWPFFWNAYFTD